MWSSSARRSKKKAASPSINIAEAEAIFDRLAEKDDPSIMSMEGISKLAEELGIDPYEDIRILVLMWKLGSNEKPSQISKQEWLAGCQKLEIDSISKMKEMMPSLDTGFLERDDFKDFYKFCFQFNRQGTHRTLDKDMVVALLKMVLTKHIDSERLDTFCDFLEGSGSYSRITLDQWTSFLDFCYECEDLSCFDESSSAWPVLLDEYVEYMEEQQKKK